MVKDVKIEKEGNDYKWIQTRTLTYTGKQMNDILDGMKDQLANKKSEQARLEVEIPLLEKDIKEIEKAMK